MKSFLWIDKSCSYLASKLYIGIDGKNIGLKLVSSCIMIKIFFIPERIALILLVMLNNNDEITGINNTNIITCSSP